MSKQRLPGSPEKTKQRITRAATRPAPAWLPQAGHPVLQLQRSLGNQRVARLMKTKRLTPQGKLILRRRVGAAENHYEQEADHVAHQVPSMPDAAERHPNSSREKATSAANASTSVQVKRAVAEASGSI